MCRAFGPFRLQPPPRPSHRFDTLPLSVGEASGSHRFGLRPLPAGSPHEQAESSSLALRTGRSPPVASHPASRRRSFLRLQAGERLPEEDLHLSLTWHTHRRTGPVDLLVRVAKRQEENRTARRPGRRRARWDASCGFAARTTCLEPSDNSQEIKYPLNLRVPFAFDAVVDQQHLVEQQRRQRLRPVVVQPGVRNMLLQTEQRLEPTEERLDRLAPPLVQAAPNRLA